MENHDFVHETREKVSTWIPDTASTDVNVKGSCAVIRPLPLLLNVITIDIRMDVILCSDTPDVMPFTITMFVFSRIIRQASRRGPEAKFIRRNKTELGCIVLSHESSTARRRGRGLYP